MKNRFGYLIAAAIAMASFSLPSVADPVSVPSVGAFYQVEVTPHDLGELATAQAEVDIPVEQSLEKVVIRGGTSNIGSGSGDSPVYAQVDSSEDWEGSRRPNNDGVNASTDEMQNSVIALTAFEVGWQASSS